MRIRRPLAALLTSLALFGGGTATLTACGDPATPNEGTTDDTGDTESGQSPGSEEQGDLPDLSDPSNEDDQDDDTQDPD